MSFDGSRDVGEMADARPEEGLVLDVLHHLDAAQPLHQNAHAVVGVLEHLEDAARGPARVQPVHVGFFFFRILLRRHPEHAVPGQRLFDRLERAAA